MNKHIPIMTSISTKKLDMYGAMTIVVRKDMSTGNYTKSYIDINLEENTQLQSISTENKNEYEKFFLKKRHLSLVHERDNIGREIDV